MASCQGINSKQILYSPEVLEEVSERVDLGGMRKSLQELPQLHSDVSVQLSLCGWEGALGIRVSLRQGETMETGLFHSADEAPKAQKD